MSVATRGRVPLLGAKIIRALDDAGLLGHGIRIIGTNAIYAYEAAAGVFIDPSLTTTRISAFRATLRVMASEDIAERGLDRPSQTDRSLVRTNG